MTKLISAFPFFYGVGDHFAFTINVEVDLDEPVNLDALRKSVDLAQARYPYFSVQVVIEDGEYALEPNPRPLEILDHSDGIELGGPEVNYHLMALAAHGHSISFLTFHGLTDGHGLFPFIKTVLYLYLLETTGQTLEAGKVRLPGEAVLAPEFVDPYPALVPETIEPFGMFVPEHSFQIPESTQSDKRKTTACTITFPENSFMKYTRESDGSPATIVSAFLFKTIQSLHPHNTELISCGMAFDRRGVLGVPETFWNAADAIHLGYTPEMAGFPMTKLATVSRGMVFLQSQPENVLVSVRRSQKIREQLLTMSHEERIATLKHAIHQSLSRDTFNVSYVGQLGFGELERHITKMHPFTDASGSGILVEIIAVHGRFVLTFMQNFEGSRYAEQFCALLADEGIETDISAPYQVDIPGIRLER